MLLHQGPRLAIPWILLKKTRANEQCLLPKIAIMKYSSVFAQASRQLLPFLRVTTEQESGKGWEFEITEYKNSEFQWLYYNKVENSENTKNIPRNMPVRM